MRRALLALVLLGLSGPVLAEPATRWVFLEGPPTIDAMRRGDLDGDGLRDLVVLHGRRLIAWRGVAGSLPAPKPTWDVQLPDDVSFVDLHEPAGLLLYGKRGLSHWDAASKKETPLPGAQPLHWRDVDGAQFAPLGDGRGGLLLPTPTGVTWRRRGGNTEEHFTLPQRRFVEAAGAFLEDSAVAYLRRARVFVGRCPASAQRLALWALSGRHLISHAQQNVQYELPTPPATGDRRLHDFDGDRIPEVFQRTGNNLEGHYAVYRTAAVGAAIRAPVSRLSLRGYQLDPELVDVNGDERDDLVITTIAMDGANVVRAVTSGRVTAETNLFLNRGKQDPSAPFAQEPDTRIKSEIGVKLRFTYAGTIDVKRSFTIVTQGDYDGDGHRDLLIRTAPDAVTVRRGTASGIWGSDGRTFSIPPLGEHPDVEGYADDLDAPPGPGRKDELILLYRKGAGGSDRLCVVRME